MKVKVEIDCTPTEARLFLGLPDVTGLNEHMVEHVKRQMDENVNMMKPEELMRNWTAFGMNAQDQFLKLLTQAARTGGSGGGA